MTDPATRTRRLLLALLVLMLAVPAASWTAAARPAGPAPSTHVAADTVPARIAGSRPESPRDRPSAPTATGQDTVRGPHLTPAPTHPLVGYAVLPAAIGAGAVPSAGLGARATAHGAIGCGGAADGRSARGPPARVI